MAMAERFVVVLVIMLSASVADATTLKTDAAALLAFKDALQDPEGALESWSILHSPCSWRGVACEGGARVVRLEVKDAALHGEISPKLGALSALKVLDLSRNRLTGALPRELSLCAALVEIHLGDNSLTSAIPGEYGALQNLEVLRLENNLLSLRIPEALARCRSLRVLNVAENLLEGEIPPSLAQLRALTVLDVRQNALSGRIPPDGRWTRRRSFFTGNHGLCGSPLQPCKEKNEAERLRNKFARPGMRRSLLSTTRKRSTAARWGLGIAVGLVSGAAAATLLALLARAVLTCYSSQEDLKKPIIFNKKLTPGMLAFLDKDDALVGYNLLGEGGNGKVYEVPLQDDLVVAIKCVRNETSAEDDLMTRHNAKQIRAELETLGFIRHRNLVQLLAYIFKSDSHLLIYEFMPGGSLQDALRRMALGTLSLSWPERHRILCGVAQGLAYLHNESLGSSIVHRDLKPANILLDEGFEAKLGDFGLAAIVPLKATHATTDELAGTIGFIAPEYHQTMRYSQKSDVYSFGVVIAQLLTARSPTDHFVVENGGDIGQWLRKCLQSSNAVDAIDPALRGSEYEAEILLAMKVAVFSTNPEPQQRPRSTEVLKMLLQIRNPEPGSMSGRENLSLDSQGSDTPILTSSGPLRFPDSTSTTQSY